MCFVNRIFTVKVGEAVWECYHQPAGPSNKIHWYVPKELEALDKEYAQDREKMRDQAVMDRQQMGLPQGNVVNPVAINSGMNFGWCDMSASMMITNSPRARPRP